MDRRKFLQAMMAGGVVVAGELWVPGKKMISIPSGKVFGNEYGIDSCFRMIDQYTVEYCGADDKIVSITEFYDWMKKYARQMLGPASDEDSMMVSLVGEARMTNPEHLIGGSLSQHAGDQHLTHLREMWTSFDTIGSEDMFSDKVYYAENSSPRARIRMTDTGHRGYR